MRWVLAGWQMVGERRLRLGGLGLRRVVLLGSLHRFARGWLLLLLAAAVLASLIGLLQQFGV